VDFPRRRAARILLPAGAATAGSDEPDAGGALSILSVEEARQSLALRIDSPASGYVRLAYAFHPWLAAEVNGEPVQPVRTGDGLVAIPVPAGPAEIRVVAQASLLRHAFNGLSLGALLAVLAVPLLPLGRRGRPAPPDGVHRP
jgi:hypothetical protein